MTLYRVNTDGTKTLVRGEVQDGYYVVRTTSLGLFAMVSEEAGTPGGTQDGNQNSNTNIPQTGDNSNVAVCAVGLGRCWHDGHYPGHQEAQSGRKVNRNAPHICVLRALAGLPVVGARPNAYKGGMYSVVSRKKKILSFVITALGLLALFLVAVNTGSLKVTPLELFKGLFIEYNENVATIYDLRFPRILIAIFGGAATAVSGVLLQAVMKNPLADPGIIGVSSGASLTAVLITAFVPTLYFFTPLFAFFRWDDRLPAGVLPFLEGRAFAFAHYSCGRGGQRHVYRAS